MLPKRTSHEDSANIICRWASKVWLCRTSTDVRSIYRCKALDGTPARDTMYYLMLMYTMYYLKVHVDVLFEY
jgi:hypothetical protein|eukprot:COSAG01_NODE_4378_length_5084_cov_10.070211_6_plen_72_part_00